MPARRARVGRGGWGKASTSAAQQIAGVLGCLQEPQCLMQSKGHGHNRCNLHMQRPPEKSFCSLCRSPGFNPSVVFAVDFV